MGQIFGYSKKVWIIILLFLAVLLSGFYVLDTVQKKETNTEQKIAIVEVIIKEDGLYYKTSWDTRVLSGRCEVYELLLLEYYNSCLEPSPDTKTKKL